MARLRHAQGRRKVVKSGELRSSEARRAEAGREVLGEGVASHLWPRCILAVHCKSASVAIWLLQHNYSWMYGRSAWKLEAIDDVWSIHSVSPRDGMRAVYYALVASNRPITRGRRSRRRIHVARVHVAAAAAWSDASVVKSAVSLLLMCKLIVILCQKYSFK